jgi:hypothetical protein
MNSSHGSVTVPADRNEWLPPARRIYYDHGSVMVTDQWLVCDDLRFPVAELRGLRTVRSRPYPAAQVTLGITATFAAAATVLSLVYGHPAVWLGLAAVAVLPTGLAALGLRPQRRAYQLWADYQGVTVLVFSTGEEKTYGHVCRALIRARESRHDDRPSAGLVVLPNAA